jgi:hypothetical protein
MSSTEAVHLFSNGFEFECWRARNCDRCIKEPTCDLYDALFSDGLQPGLYQGQVLPETAARLGYTDEYEGVLGWPCLERRPGAPGDAIEETPAAREVRKAGGVMLPGFESVAVKSDGERYPS